MGVSGSGKTTVGKLLANRLGIPFFDADDYHPAANIQKMQAGIPLQDEDRYGWLQTINGIALDSVTQGMGAVIACSALKQSYRHLLENGISNQVKWIFLSGDTALIEKRIQARSGHFMPVSLLQSQLDMLEIPQQAIRADIAGDAETIVNTIMKTLNKPELGIVGLGVMGTSLARNWAGKGVSLSLYNRFVAGSEEGLAQKAIQSYSELHQAQGFEDLPAFVASLQQPRKVFLMIKAGQATDDFIRDILPLLSPGDVLIDGGNTHYLDTKRRMEMLQAHKMHLIGAGVSGGEKGALEGPSIMPSGSLEAYQQIEPLLLAIAAKDKQGNPCCSWIGPEGAGHFVKMVHNGMEYAEMQLIAEVYVCLRYIHGMSPEDMAACFSEWNRGALHSYLLEITIPILQKKEGDAYLIDLILDVAGNKGTGNWATIEASQLGFPATMITAALFARYLSTLKESVTALRNSLPHPKGLMTRVEIADIQSAYQTARMVNHQQGFLLMHIASDSYGWQLRPGEIARIWTAGCILRSALMEKWVGVLPTHPDLFENEPLKSAILGHKPLLKDFCMQALQADVPIPCHAAALDYLNGLSSPYATANIIQAQRDYFGAHTYQKRGDASGSWYHGDW